jgi:hypothetical protein
MGFETSAAWPYPNLGANITNQPWSGGSNFVNPGQM